MKKIFLLLCFFTYYSSFSQSNYLNNDGTISDFGKREILVETLKAQQTDNIQYSVEDKFFVIITKNDCGKEEFEASIIQNKAMFNCFRQLLNTISTLKKKGYELFTDIKFEGIIFKTNFICMSKTRRYHFKFNFNELNNFPEYLDLEELLNYVVDKNENKNIIYIKNEK
jgi:hypothetical protein